MRSGQCLSYHSSSLLEESESIQGGEKVEDFFFYILKNVPIACGRPISMDFINKTTDIKYEDIYYINLNRREGGISVWNGPVEVKHAISFKNVTGQPLTPASATVLAKGDPDNKFLVQGKSSRSSDTRRIRRKEKTALALK